MKKPRVENLVTLSLYEINKVIRYTNNDGQFEIYRMFKKKYQNYRTDFE
jgi:hypothetical protein